MACMGNTRQAATHLQKERWELGRWRGCPPADQLKLQGVCPVSHPALWCVGGVVSGVLPHLGHRGHTLRVGWFVG